MITDLVKRFPVDMTRSMVIGIPDARLGPRTDDALPVKVRVRSSQALRPATIQLSGETAQVRFVEPEIEEVSFRWSFADQEAYWRYLTETSASASPVLRSLPTAAQDEIRKHIHEAALAYHSGEGYDFPAVCLNVVTH